MPIDTTALRFLVTTSPVPKVDPETERAQTTKDGQPIYTVELLVSREGRRSEVMMVKVIGEPKVTEGQRVIVSELVGFQWENEGNKGVSFSATKIEPVASGKAAA